MFSIASTARAAAVDVHALLMDDRLRSPEGEEAVELYSNFQPTSSEEQRLMIKVDSDMVAARAAARDGEAVKAEAESMGDSAERTRIAGDPRSHAEAPAATSL